MVAQPEMQDTLFRSLAQEGSLEEEMATHPVLCLENFMDRGAWRKKKSSSCYSPQPKKKKKHRIGTQEPRKINALCVLMFIFT